MKSIELILMFNTCHNYDCALEVLQNEKPDLVILDIELGAKNSFDLIKELDLIDFEIIFLTVH